MDNSVKQRLLGAAVLIALAIIFVPMFLSGSGPKTSSETANLQAPPTPDRRFQERTLSLDLPPADGSPAASTPTSTPEPAPNPNRITTVDTASVPRAEPVAESPSVVTPTVAAPIATAPESTQTPAAKPETAPVKEPVENLPGTAANGSFFVHLGDYGARKNATDLVATLKKAGYAAFTESSSFGGKPTLRVRVGPFANRADAEANRLRISQTSVRAPASVVQNASDAKPREPAAPEPAASKSAATAPVAGKPAAPKPEPSVNAPAPAPSAGKAGGWVVQLNAFSDVDDANKLRDTVRDASFPAYVDKVTREGRTLWRVRVGPQADRSSAEAVQARLRERLKQDGVVVANP